MNNFKEKVGWPFQKNKLGNVLGIKYDQLMPEAQQNAGLLACGDYDAFWHLMNQSEDIREQFCVDLLKSLLTRMQSDEILNDKEQRGNGGKKNVYPFFPLFAIRNFFVSIY